MKKLHKTDELTTICLYDLEGSVDTVLEHLRKEVEFCVLRSNKKYDDIAFELCEIHDYDTTSLVLRICGYRQETDEEYHQRITSAREHKKQKLIKEAKRLGIKPEDLK